MTCDHTDNNVHTTSTPVFAYETHYMCKTSKHVDMHGFPHLKHWKNKHSNMNRSITQ